MTKRGTRRRSNGLRVVAAIVAIALLGAWAILPQLFPPGRQLEGKPAPDFSLPVIANGEPGARLRLSDLRGSVVVIDFWATWCEPCLLQAPILERIARRHPDRVIVLGVNVQDDVALARRFARAKGLSYPVVADDTGEVQTVYRASNLPSLVVVDPSGTVVKYMRGLVSQRAVEKAIAAAQRPRDPA